MDNVLGPDVHARTHRRRDRVSYHPHRPRSSSSHKKTRGKDDAQVTKPLLTTHPQCPHDVLISSPPLPSCLNHIYHTSPSHLLRLGITNLLFYLPSCFLLSDSGKHYRAYAIGERGEMSSSRLRRSQMLRCRVCVEW